MTQILIALFILEYVRPWKSPFQLRTERFNEVILMLILYTMLCFTPWVPQIETKMKVGYLSCFFVCLHFIVNLYIMTRSSIKGTIISCRIYSAKKAMKKKSPEIRNKLDQARRNYLQARSE